MPEAPTTILLVEDERIVRITVRDALARAGYRVTDLSDGVSALRAAEAERFDIVLTDVRLPGLDGIALFRRIRQIQPDTAVLLFTAHAELDDAVAVMREGARDYVEKPFEMDELLLRLGRIRDELAFRRAMESGASDRPTPRRMPIRGISAATRRLVERGRSFITPVVSVDDAGPRASRATREAPGRCRCRGRSRTSSEEPYRRTAECECS